MIYESKSIPLFAHTFCLHKALIFAILFFCKKSYIHLVFTLCSAVVICTLFQLCFAMLRLRVTNYILQPLFQVLPVEDTGRRRGSGKERRLWASSHSFFFSSFFGLCLWRQLYPCHYLSSLNDILLHCSCSNMAAGPHVGPSFMSLGSGTVTG